MSNADQNIMMRAIELARRGEGRVSPNPPVGCVLMGADGISVGEGWHKGPGTPHAEAMALAEAGASAKGAVAYVTLEPCNHHGRTPPCAEALVAAEVSKVIIGATDPNPVAAGGAAHLQAAGIDVQTIDGTAAELASDLIRPWAHSIHHSKPYVFAKWASTLDGYCATKDGESKWITGGAARQQAHALRQATDAILVGIETILRDDPGLDPRPAEGAASPSLKVVLDTHLKCPPTAKIFSTPGPVVIACDDRASETAEKALIRAGAEILRVPASRAGVCLTSVLEALRQRDVFSVMIEGGGTVLGSAFDGGLVNEVWAFVAPAIMGGGRAAINGQGPCGIDSLLRLADAHVDTVGEDIFIRGRVMKEAS